MDTKETARLRTALTIAAAREDRGRGYPAALRVEVARHARARRADGEGVTLTARALGLPTATLTSWMVRHRDEPGPFQQVALVGMSSAPTPSGLVVHGPGGLRIEGLDLDQLVALLRRLA